MAAKKLYPDSRLMLPGSQEEAVRKFLSLAKEAITIETERECRLDDIDRLILVDTRHKSRIGIAGELVDRGVETIIYDHHPHMKDDIVADKDIFEEVGATVTILAEIIKKKRIKLSPLEATIMLIGIYEETGSLTYRITTKLDVDMVSFLLSQGANLSAVSSYVNRELTEGELTLLTKLINATQLISVKGISIALIRIEAKDYSGELGMIIHKLMEIENISVLFVLIDTTRGRVDMIGRSSIPAVDVNKILSHFGGGGHVSAAAARIRDTDIDSVRAKLIKVLKNNIRTGRCARDVMSKDVKTVGVNRKIDETRKILLEEGLEGMLVKDGKGRLTGIITLRDLNKALKRGFGHSRIKGYMSRAIVKAPPTMPLHEIQKILLDKDTGVIPVIRKGRMIGVINRTDVLKSVHGAFFSRTLEPNKKEVSNLSKKMVRLLSKEIMKLLKGIGQLANSHGASAFAVGGFVRDLMFGAENLDMDIVIEGDAIRMGNALAKKMSASIVVHKRFGTCSVITPDRLKIDLATARKEVYARPAALPSVEFSSLKEDLYRRDFTINAMAVSINKKSFGQLIDFFGGEKDLRCGRIKVLHDGSFIDDPTRIFRAVRFETRLGFAIDGHTEALIKSAISKEMFDKVEPQRIRDEVVLILKEGRRFQALRRMAELDELRFLHPKIKLGQEMVKLFKSVADTCLWYERCGFKKRAVEKWLIYLMALFDRLSYNDASSICNRFVFRRGEVLRILSYKARARRIIGVLETRRNILPSKIYAILEPLSFEVILLMMARSASKLAKTRIRNFLQKHNGVRTSIKGDDIKALGLKPCPEFKTILQKVLYAKIDGKLKTKDDELACAARLVKKVC